MDESSITVLSTSTMPVMTIFSVTPTLSVSCLSRVSEHDLTFGKAAQASNQTPTLEIGNARIEANASVDRVERSGRQHAV